MQSGRLAEVSLTARHRTALVFLVVVLGVASLTFQYLFPVDLIRFGVVGLIACVTGLLLFAMPKYGLMLAVFYIYTGMSHYFQFHVAYPIVVLVAAAVALNVLRGDKIELRSAGFNWAVALFLMLILQSMLYASDASNSVFELSKVVKSLVMVYLVVQLIQTPRDLHHYALVIYFGSLGSVFLGLLNLKLGWVEDQSLLPGSGGIRFAGTHGNPNAYAIYLATVVPIGVYAIRKFRRWYSRTLLVLGTIVIIVAIFMTFSRAAIFPLALIVVAILVRDLRSKFIFALILAAVMTTWALTPITYWHRLTTLSDIVAGQSTDWSLFLRLKSAQVAWELFLAHPFTGVGFGNFILASGPYFFHRMHVHNAYLQILVGLGIFGFIAYLATFGSSVAHFVTAMRTSWDEQHEWMRHLAFYLMVAFLSTLVGLFFGPTAFEYVTWLPAAGGLAAGRIAIKFRNEQKIGET
ncbi:MAG: O-antigen ligase family protein [Candidatus Krumholzibacteria bacterium]|nr:O-antigen ligase family protein [Candidatus Krumholzibacteria bacterium]